MFAAIAPALIAGAFAGRKRFTSVVLFAAMWSVLVYVPLAHWIWGGGWFGADGGAGLRRRGRDPYQFRRVGADLPIVLGKRRGYGTDYMAPTICR